MKLLVTLCLIGVCCLFGPPRAVGQTNPVTITGVITAEDSNEGLPGVNVVYKGTTTGTTTDQDGRYRLSVPNATGTLVFSYIGYVTQESSIGNQTSINAKLVADTKALSEVVVVGYGTQRKKDVTGSITSVTADEIKNQPASNVETLLQGRAAGVQITQSSGAPGGGLNVRIRGGSSINAGNEPLYVIDGIPVYNNDKDPSGTSYGTFTSTNALASLNPDDIESIQILKDASATAIYGSRGNNGVIIITTKRGKNGRTNVSYNAYYGTQQAVRKLDLMNGTQHAEFLNDWAEATKITKPFANPASIGAGTDWQDQIFKAAPIQNHQLSVSGGNGNINYFVSGNYFDQQGIVINSGMKRYSLRANLDGKITDKLKFSQSLTYNRTVTNSLPLANAGDGNIRSAAERAWVTSPTIPVFDASGQYVNTWYGASKAENPIAALESTYSQVSGDNLLGNVSLDYQIIEGLTFKTLLGVNLLNRSLDEYFPGATTYLGGLFNGLGVLSNKRVTNILNENTLRFSRVIDGKHNIEVLGGFTWQREKDLETATQSSNFPNDRLGINGIGGATGVPVVTANNTEWSLASYLGRINYQFNDKYLLTASFRADGSSRFGSGNQWGYFPSFAVGYRISEEPFLKSIKIIDDLKIRAGYGLTGNQEIGSYQSMARLVTNAMYIFDNRLSSGSRQSSLANSELRWEKAAQYDIGLDVAILNNRLKFVIDYYQKTTQDLLFTINLPSNSGYSTALFNTGSVENKGIELSLDAAVIDKAFKWNAALNYARNRNKITSLGRNASTTLFVGYPPGVIQGYIYEGVFHNQAEIDAQTVQRGVVPGDARYQDVNGDGVLNANDRVILGNPLPKYIFGFTNNLSYKGFNLSVFTQGSIGGEGNRLAALFNPADVSSNKSIDLVNRWTPSNPNSNIPRAGFTNWLAPSTFTLQDLTYVKIRNIQLGYTFPTKVLPFFSSANVYLSGQNLFTFTNNYSGYDPDGGMNYPTSRTVILGVNIGF